MKLSPAGIITMEFSLKSDTHVLWLFFFLGLTLKSVPVEALAGSKYCAACRAVLNDVDWAIQQVDPKKRIQVGSFRVDSQGNQNVKDKKFARSEVHITELFENICDKMSDYGEVTNEDGAKEIIRTRSHDGKMLKTRHLDLDREAGSLLKYRCHDFLENHEEEVIALLQREEIADHEKVICVEETKVCKMEEISKPIPVLPEVSFEQELPDDEKNDDEDNDDEDDDEDDDDDDDDDDHDNREEGVDLEKKDEL